MPTKYTPGSVFIVLPPLLGKRFKAAVARMKQERQLDTLPHNTAVSLLLDIAEQADPPQKA